MNHVAHLFGQVHEAITKANRVLLVAHQKPDGDTLGSSSSVLNWLIREGKDVTAFCLDAPATTFRYLDNIHLYTNDPSVFESYYDVVVVFDSGDLRYCGVDTFLPRLAPGYLLINIDHHVTNKSYGHLNVVLTDASSTAEIVHRLYEANRVFIDPPMATSLLTGLMTDTMSFSNAATNPLAVDAAAKLMAAGARRIDVMHHNFHNKDITSLKLWGTILSRLHHNPTFDMVTTYVLQKDLESDSIEIVEGLSNFLNEVVGKTDAILVLCELPGGRIKGSMRSVSRDISKVAKLLGGGGHKKAAGFTIEGKLVETPEGVQVSTL